MSSNSISPVIIFLFSFLPPATSNSFTSSEILEAYQTLRSIPLDSTNILQVENLSIKKDRAEFYFQKGTFYFLEPVLNRVTGGVFIGEGIFRLKVDNKIEKHHIDYLNKGKEIEEISQEIVFLFTDDTYKEISKNNTLKKREFDSKAKKILQENREDLRKKFRWNIPARMIADLSSLKSQGYFSALIKPKKGENFFFEIDPNAREEVTLSRYKLDRFAKFMSVESWYSANSEGTDDEHLGYVDTKKIVLDISIDKDRLLSCTEYIEFSSLTDEERMLPMRLAPTLRVKNVKLRGMIECSFIQEDKEEDAEFWIVFPEILKKDSTYNMTINYSGKDVIKDIGSGNYYVGRRTSWYPNFGVLRGTAQFKISYAVPKELTLISTGTLTKKWEDQEKSYSEWESEIPFRVAGFNYGKYQKLNKKDDFVEITCFSNTGLQDQLQQLRMSLEKSSVLREELMMFPSEVTTSNMSKIALAQGIEACNLFNEYFGEIPFKKISITQQPAGSFAQSWPTLIYLPYTSFLTSSVRSRLGLTSDYVSLAAHEIAHQWWGHTVGFDSYHDNWLQEGFAEYSSALYVQKVHGNKKFLEFMASLQDLILKKVKGGKRLTDVGSLWLGYRLSTFDNPNNYFLIYHKGAYILHMLRMMLYDYKNQSDERFISMMKDYARTHYLKNATTKSFQAIVEKHFGEKMDWFFNQWVYGTEVPTYEFSHILKPTNDGKFLLNMAVTQKRVSPDFKMPFPILINFEKGYNVITLNVEGVNTVEHNAIIPIKPKSIIPNPWHAVLAEVKK
jgi:hypothetical protein